MENNNASGCFCLHSFVDNQFKPPEGFLSELQLMQGLLLLLSLLQGLLLEAQHIQLQLMSGQQGFCSLRVASGRRRLPRVRATRTLAAAASPPTIVAC